MELIKIIASSVGAVVVLFIITKVIGNKQMSQLNMFDYINGISIGSIAAEMATSLENDFWKPLVAMIVFGFLSLVFSFATKKSLPLRRFLSGRSVILYDNGVIYKKNLKSVHLTINDLLTQCRINGYFNLADVQMIFIEDDGRMSVLPKSTVRPATPQDLNLSPQQELPAVNVILDGQVLSGNLRFTGNNVTWLDKKLREQGIEKIKDVFLATCDSDNNLSVYTQNSEKPQRDFFL